VSAVRLALTRSEAAAAIGVSLDSFERYVQPELRLVRRGRLRLVPIRELERWLDREAALTLDERSNGDGDRVRPR
jgi:hypothetical protein